MCKSNCGGVCRSAMKGNNCMRNNGSLLVAPTDSTTGGFTQAQSDFYRDNGYLLVKGVFTRDEMAAMRQDMHDLAARLQKLREIDATWDAVRGQGTTLLHCHDVQFHCSSMTRLLVDPRFTRLMQGCVGENVQLHHTKMFIKPPEKGSPFPMHQDQPYFPHQKHTMTAAVIHFDDAPPEKGCLAVYPGSHKLGPISPDNPRDRSLSMKQYPLEKATLCPAEAGDVLFFNYLTIHGSGVNTSSEARTTVLVQFRDPTDEPLDAAHRSRGQGTMLAGIDPTAGSLPEWERKAMQVKQGASA
jgi:ectoine hydroxylase-related dioxygenase (phytanoyl-CoA dioxygenase family)